MIHCLLKGPPFGKVHQQAVLLDHSPHGPGDLGCFMTLYSRAEPQDFPAIPNQPHHNPQLLPGLELAAARLSSFLLEPLLWKWLLDEVSQRPLEE